MPTLDQHIAARADTDLTARIIAAAEMAGIPNASGWATANIGRIVAAPIGTLANKTTLADVHAFAASNYKPPPRPGADPSKVTDAQIQAAVDAMNPSLVP